MLTHKYITLKKVFLMSLKKKKLMTFTFKYFNDVEKSISFM